MKTAIIACGTLRRELTAVMNRLSCPYPVYWLSPGDHNRPDQRRKDIFRALDSLGDYDRVILAMAHCGGALTGVLSQRSMLVLPRCDDCISLLLGSRVLRESMKEYYFLSRGWLDGQENILSEIERSHARYGEDRTRRIFRAMLKHYRFLGYIPCPGEPADRIPEDILKISAFLGLEPRIVPGSGEYLEKLLRDDLAPEDFLIVSPGKPISREIGGEKGGTENAENSCSAP